MKSGIGTIILAIIAIVVLLWVALKVLAGLWFLFKGFIIVAAILFLAYLYMRHRVRKWESEQDS